MTDISNMRTTTETVLNTIAKGIIGLVLAMLIAYCSLAILAGDGMYGLIDLMWNV